MKKIILLLSFAFICGTSFAQTQPATVAKPMPMQGKPAMKGGDAHPNITDAQKALENAKAHLEKAPSDFDGHRVKAIEHINNALAELKEALKWAAEHDKK